MIGLLFISRMCLLSVVMLGMNFCVSVSVCLLLVRVFRIMFRFGLLVLLWKIECLFMLFSGLSMVWLCLSMKVFRLVL